MDPRPNSRSATAASSTFLFLATPPNNNYGDPSACMCIYMAEDRQALLRDHSPDLSRDDSGDEEEPKIVFAAVAMGPVILARHTPYDGNFEDVFDHLLHKISPNDKKITFLIDSDQE